MSMAKDRQSRRFAFSGISLSAYLFGILTGAALAVLAYACIGLGTNSYSFMSITVDRMFVVKVALSASAIIVTLFALLMTIRSQLRQRTIIAKIDRLYEKTEFLSNK